MKPHNWDRSREIYDAATDLPVDQRAAYVANACAGDSDLLRFLQSLLKSDTSSPCLLDSPVFEINPPTDDLVGKTIADRYYVERELDAGGMSRIYVARDERLDDRPVVIKVLSQALVQNPDARVRLDKEVAALLRIKHPGVVTLWDRGDLPDGRPYLVMEYVDGQTLRKQIPTHGMDLDRAASIVNQIGAALEHVHANAIFHRDVKPENVLLRKGTDSVVLIDFGIAKVQNLAGVPTTVTGASPGTLVYMSPEQLRGERVTAASDVYSMAVVSYEMVTGRRPFNPATASQLSELQRKGVRAEPVSLRPNLPREANRIIVRGLSYKAKRRYQSAGEFGNALTSALSGKPVPSDPWYTQRWAWVAGVILLTVALLFAFKNFTWKDLRPSHSFTYFLMVQRMRDGKDYLEPLKSNGEETFQNGDKFQLNISAPVPGYLYVMREGPPQSNDTSFRMIYPNAIDNAGSASLGANQLLQSEWMTFSGPTGDENVWMVWSASPVSELESAKAEAFKHPRGGLTGQTLTSVKEFLTAKQLETKVTVYHYTKDQYAAPRGKSDLLVTLAQFKHR